MTHHAFYSIVQLRSRGRRWLCWASIAGCLVASLVALASAGSASELRRTAIVKAVEGTRASVINIHGQKTVRLSDDTQGLGSVEGFRQVNGMGTGVVIDPRGYVITNYHVVEGVGEIQVATADQKVVTAQLVAHDPKTDLAIIKIPTEHKLPAIRVGSSTDLMPGEPVIAVGNAYGYEHTVTRGIISALHRTVQVSDEQKYHDLIQTDASINPGNSGGPLLNIDGEMIGINVAVRVGAQGIGFAIPVDQVMDVAARLLSAERLDNISHGVVETTKWDNETPQCVVQSVRKNSPAEKGGLLAGDVVESVGGTRVVRALDFERALLGRTVGEEVALSVRRDGQPKTISIVIAQGESLTGARTIDDRAWDVLGMKLDVLSAEVLHRYNTRYRGGLKVVAVRPDSPAAEQGIRRGDILVGMHIWETISPDNVAYILNREDFAEIQPVKFYILRGTETLYGHMNVSVDSSGQ